MLLHDNLLLVSHSKESGVVVDGGGLMTISGNVTTIHHNVTNGESGM